MTKGQYVPLSVAYYEDDRVLDAGHVAETLYTRSLALAGRLLSDGFVSARQVERLLVGLPRDPDPVAELIRVGLWRPDDDDPFRPGYRIRSWLDWNRSADEITRGRERDAQRKREERSKTAASGVRKDAKKVSDRRPGGVPTDGADASVGFHAPAVAVPADAQAPAAAGVTGEPPPLPPHRTLEEDTLLRQVVDGIAKAGLTVSWSLTEDEVRDVVAAVRRAGVDALVGYARRRHRPEAPAFSAKAWLDGWRALPALRLVERVKVDPPKICPRHPYLQASGICSACRSEEKAGEA